MCKLGVFKIVFIIVHLGAHSMQHIACIIKHASRLLFLTAKNARENDTHAAEGREKPSPIEFTGTAHACQRAVTTCMKLGLLGRFVRDLLLTAVVGSSRKTSFFQSAPLHVGKRHSA